MFSAIRNKLEHVTVFDNTPLPHLELPMSSPPAVAQPEGAEQPHCLVERRGSVLIVTMNRPKARNALSAEMMSIMRGAWDQVDDDPGIRACVLTGAGGAFCAGADLKAIGTERGILPSSDGDGPMGPTRMRLTKPVIAAVAGPAVAGGLELALWCDLRVADTTAVFGVFCRRWGVPLIDGGTFRLPRLIGQSRALDMILTGRPVDAGEALGMGLANRVVPAGEARAAAERLAAELARFPQVCLRSDRASALTQWGLSEADALRTEFDHGQTTLLEAVAGAARFAAGAGRHGSFED
jgi:enoyl-CoA hydratase